MCPKPHWIDYPAPRSLADSFGMAGPIRHLPACYGPDPVSSRPARDIMKPLIVFLNNRRRHLEVISLLTMTISSTMTVRKSRGPKVMWTGSHVGRKSHGPEVTWTRSHVDLKSRGPGVTWTGSHVDRMSRGSEVTWTGSHVDRKSRGPEVTWLNLTVVIG